MTDEGRTYSDEEFALILRKAAEMASPADLPAPAGDGLTLAEMEAAAAQAGLDPTLVRRAAKLVDHQVAPSPLERMIGGPLRHQLEDHLPVTLDDTRSARLLSAVRISHGVAGHRDAGHSSAMGMTWHDGGDLESLGVTVRKEGQGTQVSVGLDRRGTFGLVIAVSGMALFLTTLFAVFGMYPESPTLGIGTFVAGTGGVLAMARRYWVSSSRKVRERIRDAMDTVTGALAEPGGKDE